MSLHDKLYISYDTLSTASTLNLNKIDFYKHIIPQHSGSFECHICLGNYKDTLFRSLCTQRIHSICETCFTIIIDNRNTLHCAMCRKEIYFELNDFISYFDNKINIEHLHSHARLWQSTTKLDTVKIPNSEINDFGLMDIIDALKNKPIKILDFTNNNIMLIPLACNILQTDHQINHSLKELNLNSNNLCTGENLLLFINKFPNLENLYLSQNNLNDDFFKSLKIETSSLGDISGQTLSPFNTMPKVQSLNLSDNLIRTPSKPFFHLFPNLKVLNLSGNKIHSNTILNIMNMLPFLEDLNLQNIFEKENHNSRLGKNKPPSTNNHLKQIVQHILQQGSRKNLTCINLSKNQFNNITPLLYPELYNEDFHINIAGDARKAGRLNILLYENEFEDDDLRILDETLRKFKNDNLRKLKKKKFKKTFIKLKRTLRK